MLRALPVPPDPLAGLLVVMAAVASAASAAPGTAVLDAGRLSDPVTRYEYGMFIEPIGGLIARSLWAEMLDDRKFYYAIVPEGEDAPAPRSVEGRPGITYRKWRPIGGDGAVSMDRRDPYVGSQSVVVTVQGEVARGIGQKGLGMAKGRAYAGHVSPSTQDWVMQIRRRRKSNI
jgi:alpha-N-arabinofuranosidase